MDSPLKKSSKTPSFDIAIEVPFQSATWNVDRITSTTSFATLLRKIAEHMEVPLSFISAIGYIPLFAARSSKPRPKLLENEGVWFKLIWEIQDFREKHQQKKKGKGEVPHFVMMIVDTSGSNEKNKVSYHLHWETSHKCSGLLSYRVKHHHLRRRKAMLLLKLLQCWLKRRAKISTGLTILRNIMHVKSTRRHAWYRMTAHTIHWW